MAVFVLSGTTSSGTPPIASKARTWASIQSGSACVQVACAGRLGDSGFDLQRRDPGDGSGLVFATLQDDLRDIVAPPSSALSGVAGAHPIAAVIEQLAGEERV